VKLGAAALMAAAVFVVLLTQVFGADEAVVAPPRPISLGVEGDASAGSPGRPSIQPSDKPSPSISATPEEVEREVEEWDDDDDDDNSGKGSDDSGSDDSGSDDSGSDDSGSDR
jgi:hypothetical protein